MSDEDGVVEREVRTVGEKASGTAHLRLREWRPEERTSRALKRLFLTWLISVPLLAVPPHLILGISVAVFVGPLLAFLAARETARVKEQKIPCPDCGAPVPIEEQPARWPLSGRCRQCFGLFAIERPE